MNAGSDRQLKYNQLSFVMTDHFGKKYIENSKRETKMIHSVTGLSVPYPNYSYIFSVVVCSFPSQLFLLL